MATSLLTPLVPIAVSSIYRGPLPKRMALCTPDTKTAIEGLLADLRGMGFALRLSDLFRSYDMQKQANEDFVTGRKQAFSPPPGGSLHESGRAMDIDLSSMGVPLARFWEIAGARGFDPVIDRPDTRLSESWHFECRGSHKIVYEYVRSGRAGSMAGPYVQMAHSAIMAVGVRLDAIPNVEAGWIQAALIRLGFDPGRIDGVIGDRTRGALRDAGVPGEAAATGLENLLVKKFAAEYPARSAGA